MIASDVETAIDELQSLVEAARVIAPFTGAGISTECGIPDFRSPGGLWSKNKPIPFDEFVAIARCAMRPGGVGSRWMRSFLQRGPAAAILHWQASTVREKFRP